MTDERFESPGNGCLILATVIPFAALFFWLFQDVLF